MIEVDLRPKYDFLKYKIFYQFLYSEVSMDRPVHGRTWTDMDMDGRTDVHGLL